MNAISNSQAPPNCAMMSNDEMVMEIVEEDDQGDDSDGIDVEIVDVGVALQEYKVELSPPKPFLVPSFNKHEPPVEILPSQKPSQKIKWDTHVQIKEIENRYQLEQMEDPDDDSYEIEIVEDDTDADFYLEIVDGEIFYVFETEDDISVDEDDSDSDSSDSDTETDHNDSPREPLQLPIESMLVPSLDRDITPTSMAISTDASVKSTATEENSMQRKKIQLRRTNSSDQSTSADDFDNVSSCLGNASSINLDIGDLLGSDDDDSQRDDDSFKDASSPPTPAQTQTSTKPDESELQASAVSDVPVPTSIEISTPIIQPKPGSDSPEIESHVIAAAADDEPSSPLPVGPIPTHSTRTTRSQDAIDAIKPEVTSPDSRRPAIRTRLESSADKDDVTDSPIRASPARSILKACPPSPRKKIEKKKKSEKSQKTYTKTYVRADTFDGEHQVYSWEKPQWTDKQLKATGKGDEIKRGGNLANPITFPKKKPANAHLENEEPIDNDELIRRIENGEHAIPLCTLPNYRGKQRKLKFSINGVTIREGGDIVKPITKATIIRKPENINRIANPKVLRSTPKGEQVRAGENLAAPVTIPAIKFDDTNHVANKDVLKRKGVVTAEKKNYEWEKPEWLKPKLNSTGRGDLVKKGVDVAESITHIPKTKYEWKKPMWTQAKLEPTRQGEALKQGEDLQAPITMLSQRRGYLYGIDEDSTSVASSVSGTTGLESSSIHDRRQPWRSTSDKSALTAMQSSQHQQHLAASQQRPRDMRKPRWKSLSTSSVGVTYSLPRGPLNNGTPSSTDDSGLALNNRARCRSQQAAAAATKGDNDSEQEQ